MSILSAALKALNHMFWDALLKTRLVIKHSTQAQILQTFTGLSPYMSWFASWSSESSHTQTHTLSHVLLFTGLFMHHNCQYHILHLKAARHIVTAFCPFVIDCNYLILFQYWIIESPLSRPLSSFLSYN